MHKIYKLILAGMVLNVSVATANNPADSIGVENNKGKKLIVHQIEAKETYYSLAKKYNVNYKDIMSFNESKFLQVGTIIKVPTSVSFTGSTFVNQPAASTNAIEYTIKAKDNLNLLAQKYGTTVEEIKRINGLNSINLQIGQVLKIPTSGSNVASTPVNESVQSAPAKVIEQTKTTVAVETTPVVSHSIAAKENLNMLAERYGTTVAEIKRLNGLSSNNLRIGQVLSIPNGNNVVVETVATVVTEPVKSVQRPIINKPMERPLPGGGMEHKVLAGETIYSIAKKYGLTTYQIKIANNLPSDEVVVGQRLMIKDAKPLAAANADGDEAPGTDPNTIKDPALRYPASKYGITQIEEKGTAVWIADQDLDPNKMLILHRTAPVGTIIKVTNPMSNRSAFAKVVGKFTENETTKDVIIVMTKAVADAVGALDKRFYCNINYGAQENEQQ